MVSRIFNVHVRGEHVGKAADFTPAHRIRLAGDGEWSHPRPPDTAGRQVAIDDGVDLVGAADGLVDALAEDRDSFFSGGKEFVEL